MKNCALSFPLLPIFPFQLKVTHASLGLFPFLLGPDIPPQFCHYLPPKPNPTSALHSNNPLLSVISSCVPSTTSPTGESSVKFICTDSEQQILWNWNKLKWTTSCAGLYNRCHSWGKNKTSRSLCPRPSIALDSNWSSFFFLIQKSCPFNSSSDKLVFHIDREYKTNVAFVPWHGFWFCPYGTVSTTNEGMCSRDEGETWQNQESKDSIFDGSRALSSLHQLFISAIHQCSTLFIFSHSFFLPLPFFTLFCFIPTYLILLSSKAIAEPSWSSMIVMNSSRVTNY